MQIPPRPVLSRLASPIHTGAEFAAGNVYPAKNLMMKASRGRYRDPVSPEPVSKRHSASDLNG
jgi:hypothetical protein